MMRQPTAIAGASDVVSLQARPSGSKDIIIGIDAGTSVIKAVAFDLSGQQIAIESIPNRYRTSADGAATQSLGQTWQDCVRAIKGLGTAHGLRAKIISR